MLVGVGLTPVGDVAAVLDAARAADESGLDAVALWDHYQSGRPEWAYVAGWAAWGAIATATSRVRLVPMVVNVLHHDLGRIAKETATLASLSAGRFELGVGAGDWPESFAAWGRPFPSADERIVRLEESVHALRRLWTGEPVTFEGEQVRLDGATVTPPPPQPPRIVVGVGGSARVVRSAASYADELNVYPRADLVTAAVAAQRGHAKVPQVSVHADWSWDGWPSDPERALAELAALGAARAFIAVGSADLSGRVGEVARLVARSGIIER
jgi:alkanesulfonate monooxygenase SsuD/methylene tetrahydromethanopterin reductase-like flavin-dependent oxidoreductase (luciferase family)